MTVKEIAEKMGLKASQVIAKLVQKKIFATINQTLDTKLAQEIATLFGAASTQSTFEEETISEVTETEIDTDMVRRSLEVASVDPDEFIKSTPLGYLPGPEGIGKAALFLASDDASFITGHNLVVDGGLTLR